MTKQEFMTALQNKLSGLPRAEVEERLHFYDEMIEDRIEDGCTEEEAVLAIGTVEEVAARILGEIPFVKIAKERIRPKRRLRRWEILLLVLGSPIWLSLGIAAVAAVLSLYVVLWSLVASLWAIFASLAACAPGGVATGIGFALGSNPFAGLAMIGGGLLCAGLAVFLFFGCNVAVKGAVRLTRSMALGLKKCFVKKEGT